MGNRGYYPNLTLVEITRRYYGQFSGSVRSDRVRKGSFNLVHSTKVFPLNLTAELKSGLCEYGTILKAGPGIVIGRSTVTLETAGQKTKLT